MIDLFCPVCHNDGLSSESYDGGEYQQSPPSFWQECRYCGYETEHEYDYEGWEGPNFDSPSESSADLIV